MLYLIVISNIPIKNDNWEIKFVICSIQLFFDLLPSKTKAKTNINTIPTTPTIKNNKQGIDKTLLIIVEKLILFLSTNNEIKINKKPIGIVILIWIKKNHIFLFFKTTIIFQMTFDNPANKQKKEPIKNNLLENK